MTTSINTPTTPQRWLPRLFQRSDSTSQAADIISTHTNDREGDTEFFASLETNTSLALFRRDEILTTTAGAMGTFTETHAVVGIDRDDSVKNTVKRSELEQTLYTNTTPQKQPRYVIKQLTTAVLQQADRKTLSRAARELVNDAKYLARLSGHANIVTLRGLTLDAFGHNYLRHQFQDFFLLRDRVREGTLHDKIYNEWRSNDYYDEPNEDLIPTKANYAFQIAKALRHCHEHGVLYRDLKPTNIGFSLDDPHLLQLLEFGLARDIPPRGSDAPFRMTLAGTRRYLAGEVLTRGEYTWKSDVYSWAMVFYELLTERKPYQGLSASQHQTYVCQYGDRPALDVCYWPEALDVILTHSWHPYLHVRWSMEQICQAMQEFLMTLDVGYYQPEEGDFLFDIEPTAIAVESWTEEWNAVDIDDYSMAEDSVEMVYTESEAREEVEQEEPEEDEPHNVSADYTASDEDPEMKTSGLTQGSHCSRRASLSSVQRRASLSSQPVTPRKVISEAA